MQLVLNTYGLQLSQRNHCFQVETKAVSRIISPLRISSILITKSVNITSGAILLAAENNIPIVILDNIGQPVVKMNPAISPGLTELRKKQLLYSRTLESVNLVRQMLVAKIEGQLSNLAWFANRKPGLAVNIGFAIQKITMRIKNANVELDKILQPSTAENYLRNWEAISAKYYWQEIAKIVTSEGWQMKGRSYRPADDEFNAALNYLYGMLYNQVETSLTCAGLDCQIGIWHRDNHQTPSLAFDVIEPLRPKIDRLLIGLLTENKLQQNLFEPHVQYGYLAKKSAKQVLISAFNNFIEDRIKMNGRITQFKNHILQMAYLIKKRIELNLK